LSGGAEIVSNNAKWVISVICGVLGIIAIIYAVIYLAIPIHSLPSFVPGKKVGAGHYHKRALLCAVIGIVLLAIAAYVGMTARRSSAVTDGSVPAPTPEPSSQEVGSDGGAAAQS
jgi:hypothetical protein